MTHQAMQSYIDKHYFTLAQVVSQANCSVQRLQEYRQANCIPGSSYQFTMCNEYATSLYRADYKTTVEYFHPSVVRWVEQAEKLHALCPIARVAKMVYENFIEQYQRFFQGKATPGCANASQAWDYFTNGTWGVCLQDVSVKCMAQKELARLAIADITHDTPSKTLSAQQRKALQHAIENYHDAAMPFDPYWLPHSSRRKEVEAMEQCYGLYL